MNDLTIRLGAAEELFVAPADGAFTRPHPRLRSGTEELLSELGARRLSAVDTVTITLPATDIHPGSQEQVRHWIDKYCELRLSGTDNELGAMRQEGLRALLVGITVLFVGLALSALVLDSAAPHAIRTFFGEGLFVVIAWVGAWYPLDLLLHYTRPPRRMKKLPEEFRRMEIVVAAGESICCGLDRRRGGMRNC